MKCSIRKPRIAVKVVFSQHLSRQVKIITVKENISTKTRRLRLDNFSKTINYVFIFKLALSGDATRAYKDNK